jgi:tripartite-type tricarboxylate transporter receptor subunit TctC
MMFDVVSLALPQIQAGRVRPIAVSARERVAVLPDVPTLIEQGMDAEVGAWFGTAGAGRHIATGHRLAQPGGDQGVLGAGTARPLRAAGAAVPLGTPDAFGKFIEAESARYGDIIRRAGIKLE